MNTTRLWLLTVVAATTALVGCTRTVVYHERDPKPVVVKDVEPGPPPHAPAHGYRHKHAGDGVILVYDTDIDVYVVNGHRDCYYSAGQYFRLAEASWEWSVNIEGPWKVVAHSSDLPPGLRHHKHGKAGKEHKTGDK
jgi:hypothetical protein